MPDSLFSINPKAIYMQIQDSPGFHDQWHFDDDPETLKVLGATSRHIDRTWWAIQNCCNAVECQYEHSRLGTPNFDRPADEDEALQLHQKVSDVEMRNIRGRNGIPQAAYRFNRRHSGVASTVARDVERHPRDHLPHRYSPTGPH